MGHGVSSWEYHRLTRSTDPCCTRKSGGVDQGMRRLCIALVGLLGACRESTTVPEAERQLVVGTWGGKNAGVIVDDSVAHAHIGCTFGNFRLPLATAPDGKFAIDGEYMLRAYPIAIGPTLPARFTGTLRGGVLTLTVVVDDTVTRKTETLGPVTVTFGRVPSLGPCPICKSKKGKGRGSE